MNISERRLGIEIECQLGKHPRHAVRLLRNAGVSAAIDGSSRARDDAWKFTHDGSVAGDSWSSREEDPVSHYICNTELADERCAPICAYEGGDAPTRMEGETQEEYDDRLDAWTPYNLTCGHGGAHGILDGQCPSTCAYVARHPAQYLTCGYSTARCGNAGCRFAMPIQRPDEEEDEEGGYSYDESRDCEDGGSSYNGYAVELVSPPLTYEAFKEQLTKVMDVLGRHMGVDRSCGLHIHIESNDYDQRSMTRLVSTMAWGMERRIFMAQGGRRLGSSYCRPMGSSIAVVGRSLNHAPTWETLSRYYYGNGDSYRHATKYDGQRYQGLNLNSHWYRGTVEFRYFAPTTNRDSILAQAALCMLTVDNARNNALKKEDMLVLAANHADRTPEGVREGWKRALGMFTGRALSALGYSIDTLAKALGAVESRRRRTETTLDSTTRLCHDALYSTHTAWTQEVLQRASESVSAAALSAENTTTSAGPNIPAPPSLDPYPYSHMPDDWDGRLPEGAPPRGRYDMPNESGGVCDCGVCNAQRRDAHRLYVSRRASCVSGPVSPDVAAALSAANTTTSAGPNIPAPPSLDPYPYSHMPDDWDGRLPADAPLRGPHDLLVDGRVCDCPTCNRQRRAAHQRYVLGNMTLGRVPAAPVGEVLAPTFGEYEEDDDDEEDDE